MDAAVLRGKGSFPKILSRPCEAQKHSIQHHFGGAHALVHVPCLEASEQQLGGSVSIAPRPVVVKGNGKLAAKGVQLVIGHSRQRRPGKAHRAHIPRPAMPADAVGIQTFGLL